MADVRDSIHIDASPERVYDLVADLPRMGEWSPECERVTWRGESSGPAPGARFVGHNRIGNLRWVTFGTIRAAERGKHLSFDIYVGPAQVSRWDYFFLPDDDGRGCTVAEEWVDRRHAVHKAVADKTMGDRTRANRAGIRATLAALKRAAEHAQP
jgi:uncharacterized protein YndB with AHSA1/START domain